FVVAVSATKAAEDSRTPRRYRETPGPFVFRQVLECGCPLPLLKFRCSLTVLRMGVSG
ncbi:MAG: hypothetical protein ACI9VS_003646, partial [Candidatus Binatia bacterium]